ncbi:MAG: hypothetical protein NW217_14040 [Hyphomicrobiaceae bacterium]|nr:hypothetical protein [Hyphomicrobiaceae bacterium]
MEHATVLDLAGVVRLGWYWPPGLDCRHVGQFVDDLLEIPVPSPGFMRNTRACPGDQCEGNHEEREEGCQ